MDGTDPPQFTTRALAALEALLEPVLARMKAHASNPVFAVAQDRNGYVPLHNREASQPQRPGDVAWNVRHSRNRRIFSDRAGLASARNLRPFLIQYYHRDLGGGLFESIKEFNAPIYVQGRHWGNVRLAWPMKPASPSSTGDAWPYRPACASGLEMPVRLIGHDLPPFARRLLD